MNSKGKEKAIRIDLGTTHRCVAVWQHDRVEIIVNDLNVEPLTLIFMSNHSH